MAKNLALAKIKATNHPNGRTLGDHFGDWFNVKGFGAVADGVTNDQPAIQAAYDAAHAAGGGTVYFPIGAYLVTDSITYDDDDEIGVRFLGESDGSIISGTLNNKFIFDRSLATPNNTQALRAFERLTINNSGTGNSGSIRMGSTIGGVIRSCKLGAHIGITTEDEPGVSSESIQIQNCTITGRADYVGAAGIIIGGGGSVTGNDIRGQNVGIRAYGEGLYIAGCRIERASKGILLGLDSDGNDVGMRGVCIEAHTFEGVWTSIEFGGTVEGYHIGGIYIQGHDFTNSGPVGPNDIYTKSLLYFNGTDGSTTITESGTIGGAAKTWTCAGNAQLDTADKKFGSASLLCDGTGDWVTTNDHANFTVGSGDFAVDFFFKCNAAGGSIQELCGQQDSSATNTTRSFRIRRNASNFIEATVTTGGTTDVTLTGTTQFTNAVNTGWHHVMLSRDSGTLRLFVDGAIEDSDTISGTVNDSANAVRIGAAGEVTSNPWTGWIDEWRFSVGVPRWTFAQAGVPAQLYVNGNFVGADSPPSKGVEYGIDIPADTSFNGVINGVTISNWHEQCSFRMADTTSRANVFVTGVTSATSGGGDTWSFPTKAHTALFINNSEQPVYTFANLPASPLEGEEFSISDSNTAVWGATAAAGGADRVVVRYNGTNWTVVGK